MPNTCIVFYLVLLVFLLSLAPSQQQSLILPCSVPNCQVCTNPGFCGLCNTGYLLTVPLSVGSPVCQLVQCLVPYCSYCSYCYIPNQCEQCTAGYQTTASGKFQQQIQNPTPCTINGCLACNAAGICLKCSYGYMLQQDNTCMSSILKSPNNCLVAAFPNICQICLPSFAKTSSYQCTTYTNGTCTVPKCTGCSSSNICAQCLPGYSLQTTTNTCQSLACSIPYCLACSSPTTCSQCQPSFQLFNNNQTCQYVSVGCTVQNCFTCQMMYLNYITCVMCKEGYYTYRYQNNNTVGCLTSAQIQGLNPLYFPPNCKAYIGQQTLAQLSQISQSCSQTGICCLQCNPGFSMIDGLCLPTMAQSSYSCNVLNCAYCIFNNYCSICNDGYMIIPKSGGLCVKMYNFTPNCLVTVGGYCSLCQNGYILVPNNYASQCLNVSIKQPCPIANCQYCLAANTCAQCFNGYQIQNSSSTISCQPICNITNCLICGTPASCRQCVRNYYFNNQTSECVSYSTRCATIDPQCNACVIYVSYSQCNSCHPGYALINNMQCLPYSTNCSSIDPSCSLCTIAQAINQCNGCNQGYTLINSQCMLTPLQNTYGCLQYQTTGYASQPICAQCQIGFVLISGMCYTIPCTTIANCQYCFRSHSCILCQQGFTLNTATSQCVNNAQYVNCTTSFNPYCTQCNSIACTACAYGYLLSNGQCYCNITNCLQCAGNAFCYQCAYPLMPNFVEGGGCVPMANVYGACQIPNCAQCASPSMCSICYAGYVLNSSNQCVQTQCPANSNCQLCDPKSWICYLCKPGYTPNQFLGQNCMSVPSNYTCLVDACSVCSLTNPNVCTHCLEFYTLNNRVCSLVKCIADCLVCLQPNTCIFCNIGYFLNTSYQCQLSYNSQPSLQNCSSINYCIFCQTNYNSGTQTLVCPVCMPGFQPNANQTACIPQVCDIPNCQICVPASNLPFCAICNQGYFLNSYLQCIPYSPQPLINTCNVYNCLYCAYNNSCTFCAPGYLPINGTCVTAILCQDPNCIQCTQPIICIKCEAGYAYNNATSLCTLNCNISNCVTCLNSNSCQTCAQNYTLSASGLQCNCKQGFQVIDGVCQCPSLSTYNNTTRTCTGCNVSNCLSCSSTNICSQCAPTFVQNGTGCSCSDSTFTVLNGSCVCPTGTTLSGSTCIGCQISNCLQCQTNNVCSQCMSNFMNVDNACQCQSPYSLQNGSVCQCASNTTYYSGQCVTCNINNCFLCQQTNVCSQCSPGYMTNSAKNQLCVQCNITNCLDCSSVNYCTQCSGSKLVVNSQGNQCVTCNVANCASCSSSNMCYTCIPGYQFAANSSSSSSTPTCVQCSTVAGCYQCSSNNVCAVCLPGYSLNAATNQCQACQYPCATCQPGSTFCATCQLPYSLTANQNGVCYTCQIPNCQSCPAGNTSTCTDCAIGYYFNTTTNTCSYLCSSSCTSCSPTGVCSSCQIGYVLPSTVCVMCVGAPACSYCNLANISICLECASGYYLSTGSTCQVCPNNCENCTLTGCLTFKEGTNQIAVIINGTTYPALCDPGCRQYSSQNPSQCITCLSGLYLSSSNVCSPCSQKCKTCSPNSPSVCDSCFSNSFLVNGNCLQCTTTSNCLTCSALNTSQCLTCPYGYLLTSSGVCQASCPLNCLSCSSSTYCNLCMEGYSANSQGICLPCISNCRYCASQANAVCLSCGQGFYLSSSSNCVACSSNCLSCTSLACTACMVGYTLNSLFVCTPLCQIPCATCSSNNPSQCTSCLAGYQFDQSSASCTPITSCTNGCSVCPFGYFLSSNQCSQCSVLNCARCSTQFNDLCAACSPGFYLIASSFQCSLCPVSCATCSSPSNCLSCAKGYTAASQSISADQLMCVQCISPCATCISNAKMCTSCVSGYVFQGWKCITSFNFAFTVTQSQTLTGFYQNYNSFLTGIANAVHASNTNAVTVNSILSNTPQQGTLAHLQIVSQSASQVTVQGAVITTAPSGSNAATTDYNQLSSALQSGNSIGGMSIASSSVVVNGGEIIQPSNSSNNLAIILGVCIPVGIIIIAVVAYFVDKKSKENSGMEAFQQSGRGIKREFQLRSK